MLEQIIVSVDIREQTGRGIIIIIIIINNGDLYSALKKISTKRFTTAMYK